MHIGVTIECTTSRRDAIPVWVRSLGLRIRNTDTGCDERWNGTVWQALAIKDARVRVQSGAFAVNWANGHVVEHSMNTAITVNAASFSNPVAGVALRLTLINTTGGNLNFLLAPAALHKASNLTVVVNGNRRRTLTAIWNGTHYDWEVGALKA